MAGDVIAGLAPPEDNGPPAAFYDRRGGRGILTGDTPSPAKKNPFSGIDGITGNRGQGSAASPRGDSAATGGDKTDPEVTPQHDLTSLPGYIRSAWSRNKRARDRMEYRLLACLRARRGEYDSTEIMDLWTADAGEPIYLPLAATKMRAAEASLRELILPDGDRPWGVEPSSVVELPLEIAAAIKQQAQQEAKAKIAELRKQTGKVIDFQSFLGISAEIEGAAIAGGRSQAEREAKKRCERMEDNIDERMQRGNYYEAVAEFIQYFCTYPTAVLKGPFLRRTKRLSWERKGWKPIVLDDPELYWMAPNPFDIYPAPEATSCQDGDFLERIRLTRADLYEMIGVEGYNEGAIRRTLEYHATGGLRSWLWADMERRQLEGNTWDTWQPDYIVDCLHYWGSVEGKVLQQHGVDIGDGDPLAYYEVDSLLVGNEVIRCMVNDDPLGQRPYHSASYDPVPGAFWGNSIYDLIKDCQAMVNACARALNANLALASGPIIGVDMSQMAVGEDPKAIRPLLMIQLDRSRAPQAQDPITFYQAKSNAQELIGVIEQFEERADDLSGIPRYSPDQNVNGAAQTMGGMGMIMGNEAKGIRRAAGNVDRGVVACTVRATYNYEMLFGDDESGKSDATIVARGSMAVIVKEQLQQQRTLFLQGVDKSAMSQKIIGVKGYAAVLREIVGVLGMNTDEVVPDEEALDQMIASQPPPQPTPGEQLKAKTDTHKTDTQAQVKLLTEGFIHPGARGEMSQIAQMTQQGGPGAQQGVPPQQGAVQPPQPPQAVGGR